MCKELVVRATSFVGPLDSIYFGGGTPSLAPPSVIGRIIAHARAVLGLKDGAEVTLEANPETTSLSRYQGYKAAGVTRISMGWQSTSKQTLRILGRGHSAADSTQSFNDARAAGFAAISIDFIFAVPKQTMAELDEDLRQLVAMSPEHVSLYACTIKPGTPFERRQMRGTLVPLSEDIEVAMMDRIDAVLQPAGYAHYEVSNYARPGHRAVHNSLYWQGGQYLGVGPGAHSFRHDDWTRGQRWATARNPERYIAFWTQPDATRPAFANLMQAPDAVSFAEDLTPRQLLTERMLCGLRQADGVDLGEAIFGQHAKLVHEGVAQATACGWAHVEGTRFRPTPLGMRNADALGALFV